MHYLVLVTKLSLSQNQPKGVTASRLSNHECIGKDLYKLVGVSPWIKRLKFGLHGFNQAVFSFLQINCFQYGQ